MRFSILASALSWGTRRRWYKDRSMIARGSSPSIRPAPPLLAVDEEDDTEAALSWLSLRTIMGVSSPPPSPSSSAFTTAAAAAAAGPLTSASDSSLAMASSSSSNRSPHILRLISLSSLSSCRIWRFLPAAPGLSTGEPPSP